MEKIWTNQYPPGVLKEIDLHRYDSIMDVFDEATDKYSSQPAFTNLGVSLSFEELQKKVEHFSSFLTHELKLRPGDAIAIQMPNLLQYPVALFGALHAGLIVVNTNPLYTATEMQHQFKDSGVKAIVILANFAHLLENVIPNTQIQSVIITEVGDLFPIAKRILVNSVVKYVKKMVPSFQIPQSYGFNQALNIGSQKKAVRFPSKKEDIALFQYTGGTTGVAKGAILTHKNVLANMLQIETWMTPRLKAGEEICITALPLYHIFSLTVNCLAFMKYGTQSILITNPRDISDFIKTLSKYKFTIMTGVNTLFNALLNNSKFSSLNFSSLKVSVAGAMSLQQAVAERWMKETQSLIVEGYGLTEASPVVCCNPIDGNDRIGSIGLPLPSTDVYLALEDGTPAPQGTPGEVMVKGPQVMRGYWQRPEETELVLQDGWLKTGDIGTMDKDGYFKIVDRKKDLIIVSGFNVYPNEVEEAIISHPGVLEVAAIGVPHESSGEAVKVFVVKKSHDLTEADVIAHAQKQLTKYKIPKYVEFRKELPKTNVGKILRRALR